MVTLCEIRTIQLLLLKRHNSNFQRRIFIEQWPQLPAHTLYSSLPPSFFLQLSSFSLSFLSFSFFPRLTFARMSDKRKESFIRSILESKYDPNLSPPHFSILNNNPFYSLGSIVPEIEFTVTNWLKYFLLMLVHQNLQ